MSVYVELRCDAGQRCTTVAATAVAGASVSIVLTKLHAEARERGWSRRRGLGWICPACESVGTWEDKAA